MTFDNSDVTRETRKWVRPLKIYVSGEPGDELNAELNKIIEEIRDIVGRNLDISIVDNKSDSNFTLFFGTHEAYGKIYPNLVEILEFNNYYYYIYFTGDGEIYNGNLFIDTNRVDITTQKFFLRKGLTSILGLPMTSNIYEDSIFNCYYRTINEYSLIDKQLIWLLYNSRLDPGLNDKDTREVLENIIINGLPNLD